MARNPSPGNGGSRRSMRRVHDESESVLSDDSSMVSSITRQSLGTRQSSHPQPSMQHTEKSDVEGGVPVAGPLDTTILTPPDRPSMWKRISTVPNSARSSFWKRSTSTHDSDGPSWKQRLSFYWQNKKELIIFGGIGVLLIVIVVVISVTVSGRDKNAESAPASPSRDQALMDIVSTISSSQALSDPTSPQYKAKAWLILDDPLLLTPSETITDQRILQRYALAVFYFATGGPETWNPNSWMQGNECSGQFWIGLSCNDNDEVRAIAFGK